MTAAERDRMPFNARGCFEVAVREQGTTTTIAVHGEWDLAQKDATLKAIATVLERSPECVVLDLSQLTFIDSTGIHVVVDFYQRSVEQKVRLVIVPGSRAVQRPFEIVGLTEALPFLDVPERA